VGICGLDACGSGKGLVANSCEHDNEPLGSIKGREFDELSVCLFFKEDSAPWNWSQISVF